MCLAQTPPPTPPQSKRWITLDLRLVGARLDWRGGIADAWLVPSSLSDLRAYRHDVKQSARWITLDLRLVGARLDWRGGIADAWLVPSPLSNLRTRRHCVDQSPPSARIGEGPGVGLGLGSC